MDEASLFTLLGDPLTPEAAARLLQDGPLRFCGLELVGTPVGDGDLMVARRSDLLRVGDLALCEMAGRCQIARLIGRGSGGWVVRHRSEHRLPDDSILARVEQIETGGVIIDLASLRWRLCGRLLAVGPASLGWVGRAFKYAEYLRRPLFPPLYLGPDEQLMRALSEAYDDEAPGFAAHDGLRDDEAELLQRVLKPGQRLLDIGCGAGREALGFARAGVLVVGLDLSSAMIARAKEREREERLEVTFEVGDPLTAELPPEPFDVIYLSPGVYGHIPGRARRIATLSRLRELLVPSGLLAFAPLFYLPRRFLSRGRLVDLLRRVGRLCGVRALSEPGDRYYQGFGVRSLGTSLRFVHYFSSEAEVEAELRASGFSVSERIGVGGEALWMARPRENP